MDTLNGNLKFSFGKQEISIIHTCIGHALQNQVSYETLTLLRASRFEVIDKVFESCGRMPTQNRMKLAFLCEAKNYADLFTSCFERSNKPRKLTREVHWACCTCELLSDEINKVLDLRHEYFYHLLQCNYSEAKASLAKIKESSGVSLWSLRSEAWISQLAEGLAGNKKWLKTITDNKPGARIEFLASAFSQIAEDTTSPMAFERQMEMLFPVKDQIETPYYGYFFNEVVPLLSKIAI